MVSKIIDYLVTKEGFNIKRKSNGRVLLSCPNRKNHAVKTESPSAYLEGEVVKCFQCKWKGTVSDVLKTLDSFSKLSKEDAINKIINEERNDQFPILDFYSENGFHLIKVARNGKNATEDEWQKNPSSNKGTWISWLNRGFNLGLVGGEVSGITIIDVDDKEEVDQTRQDLIFSLETSGTLKQKTPKGEHFVFQYVPDIPNRVNVGGLKIDVRNNGAYVVAQPSKFNDSEYRFVDITAPIQKMPEDVFNFIKDTSGVGIKSFHMSNSIIDEEGVEIKQMKEGDGRNNLLLNLGVAFSKKYDLDTATDLLFTVNNVFFSPPLDKKEIHRMLGSLDKYKYKDENVNREKIYKYCKDIEKDIHPRDIVDSLRLDRSIVDYFITEFREKGILVRSGTNRYSFKKKLLWSKDRLSLGKEYPYSIKYFSEIERFESGDMLVLGGYTNVGKTHIALNLLEHMIQQGVTPRYVYLESGSRFQSVSDTLDINGKYYHAYCDDPLSIELEENCFTIIDWLHIEEKAYTDLVMKKLSLEQRNKGGILVVFTQLKQDNKWFAPNMISQFPTFAGRYIQNAEDKSEGVWILDKIKSPKGRVGVYEIPCKYDFESKRLDVKEIVGY